MYLQAQEISFSYVFSYVALLNVFFLCVFQRIKRYVYLFNVYK